MWREKTKAAPLLAAPWLKPAPFSTFTNKKHLMNLNEFLDQIAEEANASEAKLDIKDLIQRAKKRGLIQAPGEKIALTVSARRVLGGQLTGLRPLEKEGGELATELAGVQTRWMDVTPAIAELWLRRNFNNRPMRVDTVRAYAREMRNGKWLPNHQGICFNLKDELIDGQHRLQAVVMSGVTVRMMVTFNMPIKVKGTRMTGMDTVDRGNTRTVADQLKIQHGISGGSVMALLCSRLANLCSPKRTRRLSVGEVLDIEELFRDGLSFVMEHKPKAHGLKQGGVLAAFAFALVADPEATVQSWNRLMGKERCPDGSPLALLREFLTSDQALLLTRGNDRALSTLVLHVLYAEKTGQVLNNLEVSQAGTDHFLKLNADRVSKVNEMLYLPDLTAKPHPQNKAA